MNDAPVRLLAIAPYESLKEGLLLAAESFPDVKMDAFVGDMEKGLDILRERGEEGYDAILSRGGTAGILRENSALPVIEIELSVYDILRTLRIAQNYGERFAIVGFRSITKPAYVVCDLLRYDIEILTVRDASEVRPLLVTLSDSGCRTVICDAVNHTVARELGFNAFLITSGEESLSEAIRRGRLQGKFYREMRRRNQILHRFLTAEPGTVLAFREDGSLYLSLPERPPEDLVLACRERLPEAGRKNRFRFSISRKDGLLAVQAENMDVCQMRLILFRIQPSQIALRSDRAGIRSTSHAECEHLFLNSFYAISGAMGDLERCLDAMAASGQPIMVLGEPGTGKEQIVRAFYLRGKQSNMPMHVADCRQMDEKSWEYLLTRPRSPLNDSGSTIYFQNLEDIPVSRQEQLLSQILDTGLRHREKLLFSCECAEGMPVPEVAQQYSSRLSMVTVRLLPLRMRIDELPSLAENYIRSLCRENGKRILGFEPAATEHMIRYDWPHNFTQLRKVLEEAVLLETSPYIRATTMAELLTKERTLYRSSQGTAGGIPIEGRTLEEINRDIVAHTLLALNGNQTQAAKKLGIGRTTLWRMMQPEPAGLILSEDSGNR